MGNVYTSEYLATHEVQERQFKDRREAMAFKKQLKAQGFEVKWKRYDFTDLARDVVYVVHGIKPKNG